jgi:hypothetical protein
MLATQYSLGNTGRVDKPLEENEDDKTPIPGKETKEERKSKPGETPDKSASC